MLTLTTDNISIEGHIGKWHVVAKATCSHPRLQRTPTELFMLEHSTYGNDAPYLIVDSSGHIIMDDVHNGWDDLKEADWDVMAEEWSS